jgi:hypothetical protein
MPPHVRQRSETRARRARVCSAARAALAAAAAGTGPCRTLAPRDRPNTRSHARDLASRGSRGRQSARSSATGRARLDRSAPPRIACAEPTAPRSLLHRPCRCVPVAAVKSRRHCAFGCDIDDAPSGVRASVGEVGVAGEKEPGNTLL